MSVSATSFRFLSLKVNSDKWKISSALTTYDSLFLSLSAFVLNLSTSSD